MAVVIDASMVLAYYIKDEYTDRVRRVFERILAEHAIAPALIKWEVTNILMLVQKKGRLSADEATIVFSRLATLPILITPAPSWQEAKPLKRLAEKHKLTAYDAAYLDLALKESCPIASLDKDLNEAAKANGIELLEIDSN